VSEVIPAGWTAIGNTSHPGLNIDGGLSYVNQNFTNERLTGYISGYKLYPNLTGIPGWNITLYNETGGNVLYDWQLTGGDGSYNFTGLPYGVTFNVSEVIPAGWTAIGNTSHPGLNIDGGLSYVNQNFTNERETYCVNGYKYEGSTGTVGVSGWNITVYNATAEVGNTTTNATGYYELCGLLPGEYMVCEELQPGWVNLEALCQNVTIVDANVTASDFRNEQVYCIEGRKVDAHTGNGLPDWTITLSDGGGPVGTNTTNATGYYQFCNLTAGDYTVCETLEPGWLNVSPLCYDVTILDSDERAPDFVNDPVGTISGYKINQKTGLGLSGWTIRLVNATTDILYATTTTGSGGSYSFTNVSFGPYRLEEIPQSGWSQVTPNTTVYIDMTNRSITYDFTNAEAVSYCCECPPNAKFTYTKNGLTVNFQDTSSGPQTAQWYWVFGDGVTSAEQNPSHLYARPGTYTVRLYIKWYECSGAVSTYWKSYYTRVTVP
jgi:PKD repeat protein